jgi:hypothetical protein
LGLTVEDILKLGEGALHGQVRAYMTLHRCR